MSTRCETCGGLARIKILADYRAGVPVVHHLCFQCADRPHESPARGTNPGAPGLGDRFRSGSFLALSGAALGLYTLLNRYIHVGQ